MLAEKLQQSTYSTGSVTCSRALWLCLWTKRVCSLSTAGQWVCVMFHAMSYSADLLHVIIRPPFHRNAVQKWNNVELQFQYSLFIIHRSVDFFEKN